MSPSRSIRTLVVLSLVPLAGCRTWEEARVEFIDPFNQFLHQDFPRALTAGDAAVIDGFFDAESADAAAARRAVDAALAGFSRVDRSLVVIDHVDLLDGEDRVRAAVTLEICGLDRDGKRRLLAGTASVECRRREDGYAIARIDDLEQRIHDEARASYRDEAVERGIDFRHSSGGVLDRWLRMQPYTPGSGVAAGDYDGDGFEDLFFVDGRASRLYRNTGGGRFEDVTAASGLPMETRGEGRCAMFADYDNDGALDLFVGILDAPDLLLRNRGDGTFVDRAAEVGLVGSGQTTGVAFADFDGDGRLDIYVINGDNLLVNDPEPIYNALNAVPNALWRQRDDGTFEDFTARAGVGHTGWALAVAAIDYDLDGHVDISVGNDFGFDVLYRNRGDGTFEDVTRRAGLTRRGASMSFDWEDANGDGYPDLFVGGMSSNSRWIIRHPSFPAPAPWYINLFLRGIVLDIFAEMLHGNFLYESRGDGTFVEVSSERNVRNNGWAWSSLWIDHDNDGRLDIYGANGFISGESPKDL